MELEQEHPTDRGKKGTKRSVLTDGKGIPLSVTVDGANRHDKKLIKKTLDAIIFERPSPEGGIQNICMDKGYDYPDIIELVKIMVICPYQEPGRRKHKKSDARF